MSGWASGAELAAAVERFIRKYCVLPNAEAYWAVVLWIFHTHAIHCFDSTPRLAFLSPEKQSGKTRALEVVEYLCRRPKRVFAVSPAMLYRSINDEKPTILLDEIDTIFGKRTAEFNEDVRAILNAGHRRGATVSKCADFGNRIVNFDVFAPVVVAGIGGLPETITDRSVVIKMQRRLPSETVTPFRFRSAEAESAPLREQLSAWVQEHEGEIKDIPEMPPGIDDRPADVWEPLIAVGDAIGGEWSERGRRAALSFVADHHEDDGSWGVRLLKDIYRVFYDPEMSPVEPEKRNAIFTQDLTGALNRMTEQPWCGFGDGLGIQAREIAKILGRYGIKSKDVRIGEVVKKGYTRADLVEAWRRYTVLLDGEQP